MRVKQTFDFANRTRSTDLTTIPGEQRGAMNLSLGQTNERQRGGLTEAEALKTWSPTLAITGAAGMLVTVGLAIILPLANVT